MKTLEIFHLLCTHTNHLFQIQFSDHNVLIVQRTSATFRTAVYVVSGGEGSLFLKHNTHFILPPHYNSHNGALVSFMPARR